MLKNINWSPSRLYKTGNEFDPFRFYLDSFFNSQEAYFLLGYFSSSAINLLSYGFAYFIYKGGSLTLIINDILSHEDKEAILSGKIDNSSDSFDLSDYSKLEHTLSIYDNHFFECLSYLISMGRLKFKVIKPISGGISHYKSGYFIDNSHSVGFIGSCNFTASGLVQNLESIDVYLSWEDERSKISINNIKNSIDNYLNEIETNVIYPDIEHIQIAIQDKFGNKSIEELLIDESKLIESRLATIDSNNMKTYIKDRLEEIKQILNRPRFPYTSGPREYQLDAYEKWIANDKKGIFSMATGTGKTITSLNCLLKEFEENDSYKAVIIVPTLSLLSQWHKECIKFNFQNFILVSLDKNWEKELIKYIDYISLPDTSFIIIVTYASFKKDKLQNYLRMMPSNTMIIADEAHNLGSKELLKVLDKCTQKVRIGLSATPNRQFDEEGNLEIERFFNDLNPYVYSFSMKEAIDQGFLCNYVYYPHIVYLSNDEFDEYVKITIQLSKFFDPMTQKLQDDDIVQTLLLKRKRIIHKATNKKIVFERNIRLEFEKRKTMRYTLVYAPEGNEPNYLTFEENKESKEDNKIIDDYSKIIKQVDNSIKISHFTAQTENREEILKQFERAELDVLVSMKCLDEGIDIPRSEVAFFCASTGNPRQFIQRRGRILRPHKEKSYATIHDLVVVPPYVNEETFTIEKSLILNELKRVMEFSNLSLNRTDTRYNLKELINKYKIDFIIEDDIC